VKIVSKFREVISESQKAAVKRPVKKKKKQVSALLQMKPKLLNRRIRDYSNQIKSGCRDGFEPISALVL